MSACPNIFLRKWSRIRCLFRIFEAALRLRNGNVAEIFGLFCSIDFQELAAGHGINFEERISDMK